jgi:hypothetical protein
VDMDWYLFGLANKRGKGLNMSPMEGKNRGGGFEISEGRGWR